MIDEKLKIQTKKNEDIHCVYLNGYLDAHTAPKLEETFQRIINDGDYKILVNFSELDYISSAGLGVFMAYIEDVRNNGGDIKLTSMKDKVFSVFDLLGFPMLFDIDADEQDGIAKLANNQFR
ncbi:MAG: STAS domain-containing protein [Candidatus Kapabacteria bacterium]|nr:STAS domain-containing protein [Candidatus Kapabacteria bacterium]